MPRAAMPCVLFLLTGFAVSTSTQAAQGVTLPARRLLHDTSESDSDAASSTSYLDALQVEGTTAADRLDQVLGLSAAGGLDENDVNTLLQDIQGDSDADSTANTSLSADNIIDAYGDANGTLNATAVSAAALAILACTADSNCLIDATGVTDADDTGSSHSIEWLKWTGAAILFVEALVGLLIPFFLKLRLPIMNASFLSALNCFAGGVFLTFGFMHLLPDAVSAMSDSLSDNFPMAYFFAALGFYILFLLQKVVSPMLGGAGGHHGHTHDHNACTSSGGCCAPPPGLTPAASGASLLPTTVNPVYAAGSGNDTIAKPIASESSSPDAVVECTNCGCDLDTSPETATLAPAVVGLPGKAYEAMSWRMWLSPVMMWAGICVHGVLEGLSLGLQHDKAGAVTVLVAMVSHKWVESVALSSILVKNGGGFKEVLICLLPFAACFFLGTGIGVGVGHDENPWVDIVLFGLIAGAFIFVGGYELIATEFSNSRNDGKSKYRRAGLFVPVVAGFVLVALLQLVHGS